MQNPKINFLGGRGLGLKLSQTHLSTANRFVAFLRWIQVVSIEEEFTCTPEHWAKSSEFIFLRYVLPGC
jgi:hypothetical protein